MIDVRSIQADEGELLRAVRLAALLNAPAAFLETYDEVASDPSDVWAARAAASTGEGDQLIMVALDQGRPVGMAGIAREIGQRRRHRAEGVQADINPGHAGDKPAEAEGETGERGGTRISGALPEQEQSGKGQQRQRIKPEWRVAGDGECAEACGEGPLGGTAWRRRGHRDLSRRI